MNDLNTIIENIHEDFRFPDNSFEFWNALPNAGLVEQNAFSRRVATKQTLDLVSATDLSIESIRANKCINPGSGCLCAVIYCVQAYWRDANNYEIHNFGTSVMLHKDYEQLTPIVLSVDLSDVKIRPFDYLKMGPLFSYVESQVRHHKPDTIYDLDAFREKSLRCCAPLIEQLHEKIGSGDMISNPTEARKFIDEFVTCVSHFKTLSYVYFEACSLALLLLSEDKTTISLKQNFEFNNYLYVRANQIFLNFKDKNDRFESYGFSPSSERLADILEILKAEGTIDLEIEQAIITIANGLVLFSERILATNGLKGMLFYDFCSSNKDNPGIKLFVEEQVSHLIANYREERDIDLVFNSTVPKGEIGVCSSISPSKFTISYGKYVNENRGVEIVDELQIKLSMNLLHAEKNW